MVVPRAVGRYAILGQIAVGGMASVHLGRFQAPGGFSRAVAIKRLHEQFAHDPEFVAMFLDEARVASRIRHANVGSVLDVVAEAGEVFLVMEYIQGEALSKLLRAANTNKKPVPIEIALSVVVGVLEGLHAAHEATGEQGESLGIVHRDVSPHNVLVGVDGVARVIDFGVAKAAGSARVTREGQIKGKIPYMAPEQIRAQPLDRRADIYAASVVLWEAITGRRLIEADNDAALVHLALSRRIDAPSIHRSDIPAELDRIVMRGLAAAASDRFPTAREMAKDLEQVMMPAPARDVALWVTAHAGAALSARALQVGRMEAESQITALPNAPPGESMQISARKAGAMTPSPISRDAVRTEVSSISVTRGTRRPKSRSTRFTVPLGVVALIAAAVGGFYASKLSANRDGEARSVASTTLPSDSPSSASAPSETPSNVPSATAATGIPDDAGALTASPSALTPPPKSPVGGPKTPPHPRPTPRPSGACNPPYTITADGVREYKPACIR